MTVRLQEAAFDPGAETQRSSSETDAGAGAAVTFTGLVRSQPGTIRSPRSRSNATSSSPSPRSQRSIAEAVTRFGLIRAKSVIHRYGTLNPASPSSR
jgi:molybdopterin synthase catalytic subunit